MLKNRVTPVILLMLLLVTFLSACNMPGRKRATQDTSGIFHTLAAGTVEAQLTQNADWSTDQETIKPVDDGPVDTVISPPVTEELSPSETQFPTSTNTPEPTLTQTPIPCDQVTFIKDVSIPDGTEMVPGQQFSKTWRIKNSGSCSWTSGYSLVFVSGTEMKSPMSKQLTGDKIKPGDEVDMSVDLEAPEEPGTYRANFKLKNSDGIVFGLGEKSAPFYVEIKVLDPSGVMFDFIALAEEASWEYGTGTITNSLPVGFPLAYGGPVVGTDAYVMTHKNVKLEDGRKSGSILETHPEVNGFIIGQYPPYLVAKGDKISAKIGFLAEGDGSCGDGDAIFRVGYIIGDDLNTFETLDSWHEFCDGKFRKISMDLSGLIGEEIHFFLIVLANGPGIDDKAIWDSLGIMR